MDTSTYNGLGNYYEDISSFSLLSRDEEYELGLRSLAGDSDARDALVESNLKLVVKIAHSYKGFGVPLNEIIAEGNLGLLRAAEKYDPKVGVRFSSYSAIWIKQSIRLCLAKLSRTVRIPISSLSKASKIKNAIISLEELLNREPTNHEVAEYLDFPLKTVKSLRNLKTVNVSLQQKVGHDEELTEMQDFLVDEEDILPLDQLLSNEEVSEMMQFFEFLKDREKLILSLRFGLSGQPPKTLEEVSQGLNITRERVRQIQIASLAKLKSQIRLAQDRDKA